MSEEAGPSLNGRDVDSVYRAVTHALDEKMIETIMDDGIVDAGELALIYSMLGVEQSSMLDEAIRQAMGRAAVALETDAALGEDRMAEARALMGMAVLEAVSHNGADLDFSEQSLDDLRVSVNNKRNTPIERGFFAGR
jgi:hypothetical protein